MTLIICHSVSMKIPVLVAGGAGYIGSHIVRALLQTEDFTPIVFDNLSTGHHQSIPATVQFIEGDVRDGALLQKTFVDYKI